MSMTEGVDALVLKSGLGAGGYETGDYAWSARSAKTGFVLANGGEYNRTDPIYAPLFAIIGTTYGAGNGSTTFNVPNFQSRMMIGAGSGSGLTARTRGQFGGEENRTLAIVNMPAHSHGGQTNGQLGNHTHNFTTSVNGNHTHHGATTNLSSWDANGQGFAAGNNHWGFQTTDRTGVLTYTGSITTNGDHSHSGTTGSDIQPHQHTIAAEGSGTAFSLMNPFGVANCFIKL